jgi:hypothetical protein
MLHLHENFAPVALQNDIDFVLTNSESKFPWEYLDEVSQWQFNTNKPIKKNYGFTHVVFNDQNGGETSQYFKVFSPLVYFIEERFKISVNKLLRIRIGMQTLVDEKENTIHIPHVDCNYPHKTLLYYANESDGDTIFYEQFYSDEKNIPKDFTIQKRIAFQKGSAVLFDGLQFHSSSSPKFHNRRIAININFL